MAWSFAFPSPPHPHLVFADLMRGLSSQQIQYRVKTKNRVGSIWVFSYRSSFSLFVFWVYSMLVHMEAYRRAGDAEKVNKNIPQHSSLRGEPDFQTRTNKDISKLQKNQTPPSPSAGSYEMGAFANRRVEIGLIRECYFLCSIISPLAPLR